MKKKMGTLFLCLILIFLAVPITAKADMGPKPSVRITFEKQTDVKIYVVSQQCNRNE